MVLTTFQQYWIMSTVLTTTTSLSYNVPTLHTYIVNVVLIIMMLLYTAVSLTVQYILLLLI